ncbi:hypothetical protein [Nannocystis radixulma]|uniref:DUF4375 domain-containing protein n=1 Tax=Nannocystis radixulma TaxID=2995305 RepID=A0ABT5AZ52_9BACT|nr:hypothetical protein [Nannocystis radixulma]MDC0667127.1 hypothetical protein [Nannocystis radixulma]
MTDEDRRKRLAELDAAADELYQASQGDQNRISQIWWEREDAHPLDHVEVLSADIGGYVSRIIRGGEFTSIGEAIRHLRKLVVLDDPTLRTFFESHSGEFPDLLRYLRLLEEIRGEAIAILLDAES